MGRKEEVRGRRFAAVDGAGIGVFVLCAVAALAAAPLAAQTAEPPGTDEAAPPVEERRTFAFDIPAQPLSRALRLVSGSGLEYRYTTPDVVTLDRPDAGDAGGNRLDPLVVTGTRDEGYRVSESDVLGAPLTLGETPASVTVISDDLLAHIAARSTDDFLPYVPGISSADGGGGIRQVFSVRGFPQASQYVDGVRLSLESNCTQPIETIERIEVLKGPSGVEASQASPGGYVNTVTKRPEDTYSATVFGGIGGENFRRIGGDVTGPLLGDGTVSGRLIAITEQQQW